jgi:hypothetical protein
MCPVWDRPAADCSWTAQQICRTNRPSLLFCGKRLLAKALPEPDLKYRFSLRALASSATATCERRIAGRYFACEGNTTLLMSRKPATWITRRTDAGVAVAEFYAPDGASGAPLGPVSVSGWPATACADRIANGPKTHCAGFCAGGNRLYRRQLRYLRMRFRHAEMQEVPENIDWRSRRDSNPR